LPEFSGNVRPRAPDTACTTGIPRTDRSRLARDAHAPLGSARPRRPIASRIGMKVSGQRCPRSQGDDPCVHAPPTPGRYFFTHRASRSGLPSCGAVRLR
jgi:hypothetical protein